MTDDRQGQDEQRVAEIRARHAADSKPWGQECRETGALYPCDTACLLGRLDALAAERDRYRTEWEERDLAERYRTDRQVETFGRLVREKEAMRDERDDLAARLAAAEAALAPCTLAREYRDGVTCRDERDDKGVCFNHRVVRGLRVHAVTADRLELENRALRRQVRATYGIIHEGLHGGKPTDPEHQELCERPACRNARAALAGSRERAQGEGA